MIKLAYDSHLRNNLKRSRESAGISIQKMSFLTGMKPKHIELYENGKVELSLRVIRKYAEILNQTITIKIN